MPVASHRAVQVATSDGPLESAEVVTPEPVFGQVRVRVEACGVCFADSGVVSGGQDGLFPATPGHEIAGRIDAVGDEVAGWAVGDRVALGWFGGSCGVCDACRSGDVVQCAEVVIAPAQALARIPDELGFVDAAPMGCAGVTTFNALRSSIARPGDTVAVVGLGGLGHLAVQFSAAMGFTTVAVARSSEKEAAARQLGASHFIASADTDVPDALRDLGGATVVYSTAADTAAAQDAARGLNPRGELLLSGIGSEPLSLDVGPLVMRGMRVRGHVTGSPTDIQDALRFAAEVGIRPWTETRPLAEAGDAVATMRRGDARFRMVLQP